MKNRLIKGLLIAVMLVFQLPVMAEDIDLFIGYEPPEETIPNVLIIIDNTANWEGEFDSEMEALNYTFGALPDGRFRVGIMFAAETGSPNNNTDGGYVRAAIRKIDGNTKEKYQALVNSFDQLDDKGNGGTASLVMAEAYRYLSGGEVYAGNEKAKADYKNNVYVDTTQASRDVWALGDFYVDEKVNEGTEEETTVRTYPYPNALDSFDATTYNAPPSSGCMNNYIIYLSNGASADDTTTVKQSEDMLAAAATATGVMTPANAVGIIPLTPNKSEKNVSDEWARFMYQSDQKVITYTIDVNPVEQLQGQGWSALLASMAQVSEGKNFVVHGEEIPTDPDEKTLGEKLKEIFGQVFSEIQAKNSVFASVSLPVSVNTQGTYLNQVFVGMFRPNAKASSRWLGNLKQYKMGYVGDDTDVLKLLDANNNPAINSSTGFVTECARSHWTPTRLDTYWNFANGDFNTSLTCLSYEESGKSNSPDGKVVEKGGHAYMLRGGSAYDTVDASSRTVYTTCMGASCAVTTFDTDNVTLDDLGVTVDDLGNDTGELLEGPLRYAGSTLEEARVNLINWARGADVLDEDEDGDVTEFRPSVHGDIVHSRPVAINYENDATAEPQVVVFYGGNDGMLRAINGNREDGIEIGDSGIGPGKELWAFMPPEFFGRIKRNFSEIPKVAYYGSGPVEAADLLAAYSAYIDAKTQFEKGEISENLLKAARANYKDALISRESKQYGMDGGLAAYMTESKTILYAGMRRGGRAFYAFDVSTPAAKPTLKWYIGCPNLENDDACTSGFSGMGQSWSTPQVFKAAGYSETVTETVGETVVETVVHKPMVIVGGGYDACEDGDPHTCNSTVTDAEGVESAYDIKGNKVYVMDAETGAKLAEIGSIDRSVVADVFVVKDSGSDLALFAYVSDMGGNIYRIDMGDASPSAWVAKKIAALGCDAYSTCKRKFMFRPDVVKEGSSYALLIGSGDREKPLLGFDDAAKVENRFYKINDDLTDVGLPITESSLVARANERTSVLTDEELEGKKGWYISMSPTEQVVTHAITVYGVVTFSTHEPFDPSDPDAAACGDLGIARVYNRLLDGSTDGKPYEKIEGGGLPPSPIAGMVTLDDDKGTVPFIIGARPTSPLESSKPPEPTVLKQPKSKVYWYIEQ